MRSGVACYVCQPGALVQAPALGDTAPTLFASAPVWDCCRQRMAPCGPDVVLPGESGWVRTTVYGRNIHLCSVHQSSLLLKQQFLILSSCGGNKHYSPCNPGCVVMIHLWPFIHSWISSPSSSEFTYARTHTHTHTPSSAVTPRQAV